jgi:hypothetical protein
MSKLITHNTGEDSVKRLKIVLLAFGISFSLFFTKVFAQSEELIDIYLVGGIYAVVAIIGLVWAFNFQIKRQSWKYLFQAGLFVFSEVIFVLLFFFKQFDRIYEGILLFVLLIFLWMITYTCFLMVNIFNVSLFKELPLVSVAQTASYILTLLMMYFLTFGILASSFPLYVIVPVVFLVYLFLTYMQFNEIGIEKGRLWSVVLITSLINLFILTGFLFVGSNHEIVAIVPMIVGFVSGGLLTLNPKDDVKWQVFGYNLLIFVVILIAVYVSWF